jgi:RecA/RadA recombinase
MRINKLAKQIEKFKTNKGVEKEKLSPLFKTGSTLLDLACSDRLAGAFQPGTMINIIGDSHTGKTFLAHSIFTEALLNPKFKNYELYYDNAEAAPVDGIRKLFGGILLNKIKNPSKQGSSETIQDWKVNIWKIIQSNKPFIYILDSLDSLSSHEAHEKLDKEAEGKTVKGSYNMEKPKMLSNVLGTVCRKMEKTNSLLIILSQTRDNINPMSFIPKTRSGGKALKFYACTEMWMAKVGTIKKKDRIAGSQVRIKITKSKLTGKVREVEFPLYHSYGIDDISSCIDFLVNEKIWNKVKGGTIIQTNIGLKGSKETVIKLIEEKSMEEELQKTVSKAWREIEESLKLKRKPRYKNGK